MNGCGPGGWYDGHGWYSLIGAFIEETGWTSLINFKISFSHATGKINANDPYDHYKALTLLDIHRCPSDIGLHAKMGQ